MILCNVHKYKIIEKDTIQLPSNEIAIVFNKNNFKKIKTVRSLKLIT